MPVSRPGTNGDRLSVDGGRPAVDGDRPAADGGRPTADGGRPTVDGGRPAADGDRPAVEGGRPTADGDRPTADGDRPTAEGGRPTTDGNRPTPSGDRPTPSGDRPTAYLTPHAETYSLEEVVRISGLDAETLRWYEDQGLIEGTAEDPYGVRAYSPVHLRWLEFLNHLRGTGMSPADMNDYVELYRAGDSTIAARRNLLEAHREVLRGRSREFDSTLRYLDWKIGFYLEREAALVRAVASASSAVEA